MISLASITELLSSATTIDRAQIDKLDAEAQRVDAISDASGDAQRAAWLDTLRSTLGANSVPDELVDILARSYADEGEAVRLQIARLLASVESRQALAAFVDLMLSTPPERSHDVLLAFTPLFQRQSYDPALLFPRLLDALANPLLAAVVLELGNFLMRRKRVEKHPAAARTAQLSDLLGQIVLRLQSLEEHPETFAKTPQEMSTMVGDSVALVIALCDALALIGDPSVVGKLHQALELSHRRVRTEAAAALARLGDKRGPAALAELAAMPAVRQRALAYLDELGMIERAKAEERTPEAQAAGELAAWLASPTHFGAAPSAITPLETRRLSWPGYDEPVECRLFDFEYQTSQGNFSSVAIVGPVTHALMVDLEDLAPSNIFALYAGWHAEHPEISEQLAEEISPAQATEWKFAAGELVSAGYKDVQLVKAGRFFGTVDWVATAVRDGHAGVVIVSDNRVHWYPSSTASRGPGPNEFYWVEKGRRLLSSFDPNWERGDVDEKQDGE